MCDQGLRAVSSLAFLSCSHGWEPPYSEFQHVLLLGSLTYSTWVQPLAAALSKDAWGNRSETCHV